MTTANSTIASCVGAVRQRIAEACARAHRKPEGVRLIAVTKNRSPQDCMELSACGLHIYGENRVDHLQQMAAQAPNGSHFHYLGRVQRRQFPDIVSHCTTLHSLAKSEHLAPLAKALRRQEQRMQAFIQVNPGIDPLKAGISPGDLAAMLEAAVAFDDCLQIIGLMTMAPDSHLPEYCDDDVRRCFASLRQLADQHQLPRVSMGMSGDFEIAIEEGATDLRIGSALFPSESEHAAAQ
ncbi:MAG: YggS family pyridoxal phosphate-dependent enzyme [Planctomycetota bacterium]|nr:MAG: YggS family pyridoxal phosphate-dependent enzyme [Planctomycetota bacterium]